MVHRHRFLLGQFLWTVLLLAGTTSRLPAQEHSLGSVSEDAQSQAETAEVVSLPEITGEGKTLPTAELQAPDLEQLLSHLEAFRKAHTPFHIRHREVIKLRNASEVKALESMGLPPGMLLDTEYESAFWDNRSWKRCLSRGVDGEPASDKRSSGDCEGTAGLDVPFALLGVFIEPKLENCKLTFDDIFPHITITADEHKRQIELWMFPVSGHWIPKRLRSTPEDKEEPVLEWEVNHIKAFGKDRPPQIIDGEVRFTVRNGEQESTITSEFFITKSLYGDDVVPREIDSSLAPMPAQPAAVSVVDAPVMNTPVARNGPQLRAQPPTVLVIETTSDIERSEVIRKVVEAMEKEGRAKRGDIERVGKPVGLEAILSPVHDMSHEKIIKLIEVLQSLGVDRMRFSVNNEQKESTVIIQCPPDIAWRKVRTMTEELEKTRDFKVDVRVAASDESITPVAVGSLSNANRVPPTLPRAEELPSPSKLQDGFSPSASRPASETSERGELKVFLLQNIQAKEAGQIIEQLYITTPGGHDSFAIRLSVDDRNNSLIVRGDSAVIAEVEALLLRIDTKQSEPNPADRSNAIGDDDTGIRVNVPALGPEPLAMDFSAPVSSAQGQTFSFSIGVSGQNADDLQRQYEALEQRARSLSGQLREPLPDPATGETLRSQLRDTVRQAFETRQNLQRAELAEFAKRLQGIQHSIEMRERVSQQIIDRRVQELLNPNLSWDEPGTNSGSAPVLRSSSPDTSIGASTHFGAARDTKPGEIQTVQIKFDSRKIGKVEWLSGPGSVKVDDVGTGHINAKYGERIQLQISEIPGRENALVFLRLEVSDDPAIELRRKQVVNPAEVLSRHAIPLDVTSDDLDQAISGNAVTKVIYLPHDRKTASFFENVVSTRLEPNIDTFKVAREKGVIVAVARISNQPNSDDVKSGAALSLKSPGHEATYDGLSANNSPDTTRDSRRAVTTTTPDVQPGESTAVPSIAPALETTSDTGAAITPGRDHQAVSKLVLIFFQDKSRRAVPAVMIRINDKYFAVTAAPATIVPEGTIHAIDRCFVEWKDGPPIEVTYDDRSTKELYVCRFPDSGKLPESLRSAALSIRDLERIPRGGFDLSTKNGFSLTAITVDGEGKFSETPVHVVNVDVTRSLKLPEHKVEFHYEGLIEVDVSVPEGSPIFLDGKLMGLTILGSRFAGEESGRSFVAPLNWSREF